MTTRDGTKLAYSVHPPTDVTNVGGVDLPPNPAGDSVPSPTLIEYSGYGYARPEGPQSGIAALANLMGFTVVDVNMRGTGCSGGAFDFFEPLQNLDGYDVIETVSRQPWVAHNKVGMMGISYGGISQLFTAQTRPPSLAAIAPLSVIDQVQTTLYPGGILNTGFAFAWAQERIREARPADPADPNNGAQSWAVQRVAEGDTTCEDNQDLHPEAADLEQKIRDNDHYVPEVADPLSPLTFVDKINVPVFMACQWTDEQTGGHCPTLAKRMTGTDKKWFTFTNGTHVDSLSPEIYNRLYDFLHIYVGQQAPPPAQTAFIQATAPVVFQAIFGIDGPCIGGQCAPPAMTLPPDPIQAMPTYELAKAAFEAQLSIRVLFDNGAGNASNPGWPYPAFEHSFAAFPVPGTTARSWYLAPDGALADAPAAGARADAFTWDADARPLTNFTGDTGAGDNGLWTATPPYQWSQDPARNAVAYVTAAAERGHDRGRRRPGGPLGALLRAQRRPAGDDQRGPAGRQGDLRAERLGAGQHRERSTRPRARSSSRFSACARRTSRRCPPTSSCRSRSRSTTRGTPIAQARASASGSRRPTATSRSGRSARPSPPARPRSRSATATRCRPASSSRWCPASTCRISFRRARACAASRVATTCRSRTTPPSSTATRARRARRR